MEYYAGIDVSLKESSVCIVDAKGKVASEPEALVHYFDELELPVCRIGLEAGPLSHWLHAGLAAAGRDVVLLETRHVKAALSAMTVKTDRKDARGIAQLLRMGWYRPVHAKSVASQDTRAVLVGRKLLQGKLLDVELSIRGILRGYVSARGHAFIDRALYLPKSWTGDPARLAAAHVPEAVAFATKPALAVQMIQRALAAEVPFSWVAADAVYGIAMSHSSCSPSPWWR